MGGKAKGKGDKKGKKGKGGKDAKGSAEDEAKKKAMEINDVEDEEFKVFLRRKFYVTKLEHFRKQWMKKRKWQCNIILKGKGPTIYG